MLRIKYILPSVVISLIIAVFVFSCKKENKQPSKTEIITGSAWKMSAAACNPAIQVSGFPLGISDIYPFLPECAKDNYTVFYTDGKLTSYEGTLKCDSSSADSYNGSWVLSDNDSKITISNFNGVDGSVTFDVVEITPGKMSFRQTINSVADLADYTDTTGVSSMVIIQPGTQFTVSFIPK